MSDEIKLGDIYEDCSYHPVICTEVSYGDDHIEGTSMIDGSSPRSCSLKHCGVRKLTEEQANEKIEAHKQGGTRALMRLAGWPDDEIEKFMKEWRPDEI